VSLRIEVPSGPDHFDWRLPVASVVIGFLAFVPGVFVDRDGAWLFYLLFMTAMAIALAVFVFRALAKGKQLFGFSVLAALVAAIGVVALFMWLSPRDKIRWFVLAHRYKQEVIGYQPPPSGDLWHTYWDGWGAPGDKWDVFVVYDPSNSLLGASKTHQPVRASGIPCEVPDVERLRSQWYTVKFYMNETWGECPPATADKNGAPRPATK
jgi:hypothetical protein